MDGRAKPGHDGGGQSMRELKRLLFRGSLVRFYPDWRPHRQSGAHVTGLVPGIGPAIHVFVAGIETDMDIRPSQPSPP
jgi:hypothetical protein